MRTTTTTPHEGRPITQNTHFDRDATFHIQLLVLDVPNNAISTKHDKGTIYSFVMFVCDGTRSTYLGQLWRAVHNATLDVLQHASASSVEHRVPVRVPIPSSILRLVVLHRSEERSDGKECVSKFRYRRST